MNKNSFWGEVLTDSDNSFCFKRLQTAIFTVLFIVGIVGNMFWHMQVSDNLMYCLASLLGVGATSIATEQLMSKGNGNDNTTVVVKPEMENPD